MTVTSLFFAHLQDIVGERACAVTLPVGATVLDLAELWKRREPALSALLDHTRCAVNAEFASLEKVLHDQDEVAFLPPMSGG